MHAVNVDLITVTRSLNLQINNAGCVLALDDVEEHMRQKREAYDGRKYHVFDAVVIVLEAHPSWSSLVPFSTCDIEQISCMVGQLSQHYWLIAIQMHEMCGEPEQPIRARIVYSSHQQRPDFVVGNLVHVAPDEDGSLRIQHVVSQTYGGPL